MNSFGAIISPIDRTISGRLYVVVSSIIIIAIFCSSKTPDALVKSSNQAKSRKITLESP